MGLPTGLLMGLMGAPVGPARSGGGFVFLLRDDFLTAASAPLASPRTCEPGPGTLVVDANVSITGGELVIPAAGDYTANLGALSESVGLMFTHIIRRTAKAHHDLGINATNYLKLNNAVYLYFDGYVGAMSIPSDLPTTASNEKWSWLLGKNRAFILRNDSICWVVPEACDENNELFARANTTTFYEDSVRVARLPGAADDTVPGNGYEVFGHRDLDVTDSIASPVDGNTFSFTADFLAEWEATADGSNNWVYFDYSAGNRGIGIRHNDANDLYLYDATGAVGTANNVINTTHDVAVMLVENVAKVWVDGSLVIYTAVNLGTGFSNLANGKVTNPAFSNLTTRTLDGIYNSPWESDEKLTDGDMELADTSAWDDANGAVFSKVTTNPHSGSRLLRVTNGVGNYGEARQSISTVGVKYRATGYARSADGAGRPRFRNGGGNTWIGTTSTSWQPFDVEYTASDTYVALGTMDNTLGTATEWDDLSVVEVKGGYDSANHPGYGLATDVLPGPRAEDDVFTHEADGVVEWTVNSITTAGYIDIWTRQKDNNNYWRILSSNSGYLRLYEVVAGTPTERANAVGVLSGGERVVIVAEGEVIKAYYDTTPAWTYSSAANFKTETSGKIESLGTNGRISNLIAWPRNLASAPNTPGAEEAKAALDAMSA